MNGININTLSNNSYPSKCPICNLDKVKLKRHVPICAKKYNISINDCIECERMQRKLDELLKENQDLKEQIENLRIQLTNSNLIQNIDSEKIQRIHAIVACESKILFKSFDPEEALKLLQANDENKKYYMNILSSFLKYSENKGSICDKIVLSGYIDTLKNNNHGTKKFKANLINRILRRYYGNWVEKFTYTHAHYVKKKFFFNNDMIKTIFENLKEGNLKRIIQALVNTGSRIGALVRMQYNHWTINNCFEIIDTKNGANVQYYPKKKLKAFSNPKKKEKFVFYNKIKLNRRTKISYKITKFIKKTFPNITKTKSIGPHCFRVSVINNELGNKMRKCVQKIADKIGHRKIDTTWNAYIEKYNKF